MPARKAKHVHNVCAIELRQIYGLLALLVDTFENGRRDCLNPVRLKERIAESQHAWGQTVEFCLQILPDISNPLQRKENALCGAPFDAADAGQLRQPERASACAKHFQDLKRFVERAHESPAGI